MSTGPHPTPWQAANVVGSSVVATAEEMKLKPAGQADYFDTLNAKITETNALTGIKYGLKEGTPKWTAAASR